MLLIITNREDLTADYLITDLLDRSLPFFRLNSEDLPDLTVAFSSLGGSTSRTIISSHKQVSLDSISSVWYRRIIAPRPSSLPAREFRSFEVSEMRHLAEGLVGGGQARWVNPLGTTEFAERKILQLRFARECGLDIPNTIATNDPDALREFAATHDAVICKPLSTGLVAIDGDIYAIHTEMLDREAIDSYEGRAATLLQERIVGRDIRITVIGDRVFPVEITTPPGASVDWRKVHGQVSYATCHLPAGVGTGIMKLMGRMGLVYGAFDFMRTEEGMWYFLEVNPVGEWAWLDMELGLNMRSAFIELFYGAAT